MTAGMNTGTMGGTRITLPRAGLGALLAATLLAGGLIGAGVQAGISAATASTAGAIAAVPREATTVRDARLAAGNGQLVGDASRTAIAGNAAAAGGAIRNRQLAIGNGPLAGAGRGGASSVTRPTGFPAGRDGFGFDQVAAGQGTIVVTHATGRGALR